MSDNHGFEPRPSIKQFSISVAHFLTTVYLLVVLLPLTCSLSVASVLILLLEWPRSKRKQGTTVQRTFQLPLTKLLSKMRPVSDNYYVRYVLHLLLSVPCCFLLPTIMGAMSLLIAAFIYLLAAIKGEHWQPVEMNSDFSPDPTTRPNRAPPRNIQTSHLC